MARVQLQLDHLLLLVREVPLDLLLLVSAFDPGTAVEGVVAVVAAEADEALGLDPVAPEERPGHGRLQVVVADAGGDAPEVLEGVDVPGQERLLGLGGEDSVDGPARVAEPQGEQPELGERTGDDHLGGRCLSRAPRLAIQRFA